jgi:hypothetical protein
MSPSPKKNKPNGSDPDHQPNLPAPATRGKQKPRSHRVRHPKEAECNAVTDSVTNSETDPARASTESPITQAAAILEEEQRAEPVVVRGLSDDDRDKLRAANAAIEATELDLARAKKRLTEARAAFDKANVALHRLSIELANGTNQPGLPFDAAAEQTARDAMLQADREANTPALIERLRRARYLVTREQLDALEHTDRHQLAEFVKKCEAAILDGSVLNGVVVPALLAAMHVANDPAPGEKRQYCTLCGMMLQADPAEFWDPGLRVGQDCAGVDVAEERTDVLDEPETDAEWVEKLNRRLADQ